MPTSKDQCVAALVGDDLRIRESIRGLLYSAGFAAQSFCSAAVETSVDTALAQAPE